MTIPFSPAKLPTSTSDPVLSWSFILGSLSPDLSAPLPPVSAGADLGASASSSACSADFVASADDFVFPEVDLTFFDKGPDFGFS